MSYAKRKKKTTLVALTVEQHAQLKLLNERTRVPLQAYM